MNGWITKQQCIILSQQPTNFLAVADCLALKSSYSNIYGTA